LCSRPPCERRASYRAGRLCVLTPRTCSSAGSDKPDCQLIIRHSFRATGITNFLENAGTLEAAQRIAGHADSRTTKLYDRRGQKVLVEDMERNAELGISLQMSSTVKCGGSRT